ncbi:hypothetical protein [Leptothoe sp. PORK10 BA2]|uniref:hypothetical protein n=1 Tax=Leptothoe sp. PORK10 BA2 TaxID=3110254 RepID=UPI002B20944B|nr:hypothetical protein [Leptothoe sp. PORK10 BA2]MEA5464951.1 hypothetical protein [Leptothoe sp. PORK10 BA2]
MIDLYAWATPNSIKVPILLEELGLAYTVKPVNVRQGEQKTPLIRPHVERWYAALEQRPAIQRAIAALA